MLKKIISIVSSVAIAASSLLTAMPAGAEAPRPHRPDVTSATPDKYNANWVTGISQDGGVKGQSLKLGDNSDDASSFAFYSFRNWWDQDLSDVTKIRASFLTPTTTINGGGSPRFSLMLDANGDGVNDIEDGTVDPGDVDVNVFLDPATCSDPASSGGGWVEADFTGDKTDCTIFDSTGASYTSDETGTAWEKLVEAYPDAKVWFMFLIQDASVGPNYVDRIMLDSAFFTKAP